MLRITYVKYVVSRASTWYVAVKIVRKKTFRTGSFVLFFVFRRFSAAFSELLFLEFVLRRCAVGCAMSDMLVYAVHLAA